MRRRGKRTGSQPGDQRTKATEKQGQHRQARGMGGGQASTLAQISGQPGDVEVPGKRNAKVLQAQEQDFGRKQQRHPLLLPGVVGHQDARDLEQFPFRIVDRGVLPGIVFEPEPEDGAPHQAQARRKPQTKISSR